MKVKCKSTLILLCLVMAFVASFYIPRRDLRSITQVAGIALDATGATIKATFELYDAEVDQPIGSKRAIVSSEGGSIQHCLNRIKQVYGKELYIENASVLIINSDDVLDEVFDFYSKQSNNHMNLPVFYVENQYAYEIFEGEGEVISTSLADSAESLGCMQSIRDLMNGEKEKVFVRGSGNYEILL